MEHIRIELAKILLSMSEMIFVYYVKHLNRLKLYVVCYKNMKHLKTIIKK